MSDRPLHVEELEARAEAAEAEVLELRERVRKLEASLTEARRQMALRQADLEPVRGQRWAGLQLAIEGADAVLASPQQEHGT